MSDAINLLQVFNNPNLIKFVFFFYPIILNDWAAAFCSNKLVRSTSSTQTGGPTRLKSRKQGKLKSQKKRMSWKKIMS